MNRGTIVQVTLPSGKSPSINYNCTLVPLSNSLFPTIWFESSAAHGVVNFLGLQTSLALKHSRNSCSYDPPNFGWSSRLPADSVNYFDCFNSLLRALGRQNEEIVLVGWGGGAQNALVHAIKNNNITKSAVLLDSAPDGLEWLDAQRKNCRSEAQMLNYCNVDL